MPSDRVSAYIEQFRAFLKDPAKPFTLLARLPVKDGMQAQFEAAFARAKAATRGEPGVLAYDLNRETTDGGRYVLYERWRSLAELEAHLRTPYITKFIAETDEALGGDPEFHVLAPAGETVSSGT